MLAFGSSLEIVPLILTQVARNVSKGLEIKSLFAYMKDYARDKYVFYIALLVF